jgi:hypothetical protein
MKDQKNTIEAGETAQRRRFLRLIGTAAALLPITAITGCSDDTPPPPSPSPAREPESAVPEPVQPAQQSTPEPEPEPPARPEPEPAAPESGEAVADAAPGELPPVELDDPTAQALGYKHDADNVDAQRYPDRDPAHRCSNCILYTGDAGDQWGPCSLFPGRVVNANGWCSSYTPRPA